MQGSEWQKGTLDKALRGVIALGLGVAILTVVIVVASDVSHLWSPIYVAMMAVFGVNVLVLWFDAGYSTRAHVFVTAIGVTGWLSMLNFGLAPGPLVVTCLASVVAGVFLGRTALLLTLVLSSFGIILAGLMLSQGVVVPVSLYETHTMFDWVRGALEFFLTGGSVAFLIYLVTLEIERQEASIAESRRLESLGRLAGGVAHDFNNTLQVIFAWTDLLGADADSELQEGLDQIQEAAERASQLTAQLLAYGRRSVWAPVEFDLAKKVEDWGHSMQRLLPEDVDIVVETKNHPVVLCDPGQLSQILLNLVVNARDAMEGGGRVEITVDEVPRDPSLHGSIETSNVARIVVRDSGQGIDPAIRDKIFEPFFTTKGQAGTGLGLSIVHSAVRQAKGVVDVESGSDGTVFTIALPTTVLTPDSGEDVKVVTGPSRGVILLAEDEPAIRETLSRVLINAGFTLLVAADCHEALEIVDTYEAEIDILVTDAVMPGPPTREVIDRFKSRHPSARVLVCSGHVEDELESRDLTDSGLDFLAKPFTPSKLLVRLSNLLGESL